MTDLVKKEKNRIGWFLISLIYFPLAIVWPLLKWFLAYKTAYHFVRMLYHWGNPAVYAGWDFLLFFGLLTAIGVIVSSR